MTINIPIEFVELIKLCLFMFISFFFGFVLAMHVYDEEIELGLKEQRKK